MNSDLVGADPVEPTVEDGRTDPWRTAAESSVPSGSSRGDGFSGLLARVAEAVRAAHRAAVPF